MSLRFVLKRLFNLIVALFFVATLTFFLMRAIPGDPFVQDQAIPKEVLDAMHRHYGLDQPIWIQYLTCLKKLVTFSLGPSFKYEGRTVNEIIASGFPISFTLGLTALVVSISSGILFGSIAAVFRGKWQDRLFMIIAVLGVSIPNFVIATLLQYLFAIKFPLFPIARWGDISHMVLPTLSLSALPTAFIARLIRANMIEILEQDYIIMARAKGLSQRQIIFHHVFKNALLPVITYIGHISAGILTGSFIIEKIFGIPGLGNWFVSSISSRDYTMIMGITMFYSSFLMITIFIVDIIYYLLDPRIGKHHGNNSF
ncbi:MAG: ABC transporter permease [Simkaniaceae bacterium]|nr:ABC transporter permease [Simkaniaceae bacterium]